MTFRAERQAGSRIIRLSGELDLASVEDLDVVLNPLVQDGGDVILEVADLTFMDSSGLHRVLRAARTLGDRGRVIVRDPTRAVMRLLELTGAAGPGGLRIESKGAPS